MRRISEIALQTITKRWFVFTAIAMLATATLALSMGKGQDIWFDEGYSILLAQQPVDELLRLTAVDAHPPFFYLLLKVWGSIFGWSELALRSFSAILAAVTVGVVAVLIRVMFTPRIALATLPFMVLAPFWIRYGYEIRMYALAGLISAIGTLILIKAVHQKSDKKWWVFYALTVATGMYTLYMTVVVWLAHFVWLGIYHNRRFWKQPWFWSYVGAVAIVLPYVPTILWQMSHSALPGIGVSLNLTHIGEVASMLLIYTPEWSVGSLAAVGILVLIGTLIYLTDRVRHRLSGTDRQHLTLMICLACVPFAFFVFASLPLSQPFFVPRYLAHVSIYIYAFIGVIAALGWRYGYRLAAGVLFLTGLTLLVWGQGQLALAGNFNYERMQRPQTSKVRQVVDCYKSVVIADDAYTYINAKYYFERCDLRFYSKWPMWYQGGYAWLANNGKRVASPAEIKDTRIVHLYWNDSPKTFHIDGRYKLVASEKYDQQITDTYELIVE